MNVFSSHTHTPSTSILLKLRHSYQRSRRRTISFEPLGISKKFQMSRKTSKRVSFSPDLNDKQVIYIKQVVGMDAAESRNRTSGIRTTFKLPKETKLSPVKFLWSLKSKVEKAITIVSMRSGSSGRVSATSFKRSNSVSESMDSHRAEANEDCIEFLNSSSSLYRSNSVSGSSY